MAEETTQNATPEVAKELVQHEFWVSGILNGQFVECDGPYYTTKDIPKDNYPYTTTQPNPNFTHQKYDYINHKWVDTSADALLHEVESMKTDMNDFKETATTLKQGFANQSKAQEAKDKETGKTMNLLSLIIKQVGTMSDKIDSISAKLNEKSASASTDTKEEGAN
jgi:hypothetical protein